MTSWNGFPDPKNIRNKKKFIKIARIEAKISTCYDVFGKNFDAMTSQK